MTIALAILNYYDHGTARRDFRDLALELARRGHRVVILAKRWHAEMLPGIQHVRLAASGFTKTGKLISFGKKVRRYCRSNGVDRLVGFSRIPGADFYYLGNHAMAETPFRFMQLLTIDFWRERRLEKQLFAPGSQTKIFALSPTQVKILSEKYHAPAENVKLLPLGVPGECRRPTQTEMAELRSSLRRKYAIAEEEKVLVMMGSGFHHKGVDRAIMALCYLPETDLQKFRLVVCGKGSVARMDSLARHYNVRKKMIFAEETSRVAVLAAADMALCLARHEYLESTPLEAIVCGIPAAVTAINDFSDFVSGCGGTVFPEPFQVRALTQFLHRVATEPEFFAAMKRAVLAQDPDALYHRVETMANQIEALTDDLSR